LKKKEERGTEKRHTHEKVRREIRWNSRTPDHGKTVDLKDEGNK